MPCDQVILNKVEITTANLTLLYNALAELISRGELSLRNLQAADVVSAADRIIREGQVSVRPGQEYLADKIKQEYSRQVVQAAARKFGWRVQQKAQQKLVVTRRV